PCGDLVGRENGGHGPTAHCSSGGKTRRVIAYRLRRGIQDPRTQNPTALIFTINRQNVGVSAVLAPMMCYPMCCAPSLASSRGAQSILPRCCSQWIQHKHATRSRNNINYCNNQSLCIRGKFHKLSMSPSNETSVTLPSW